MDNQLDQQEPEVMSDDQVLAFTQHKRKFIVTELVKDNKLPGDNSDRNMLLQALDGMDRAALGNKRIKADEKTSQGIAGAAGVVAQLLAQLGNNSKPNQIIDMVTPVLPNTVPDPVLVPGETETNAPQLDYDSFININNNNAA